VENLQKKNPEGYIHADDPVIMKHYQLNVANKQGMGPGINEEHGRNEIEHLYPDQTNDPLVTNDPRYRDPDLDPRNPVFPNPNINDMGKFSVFKTMYEKRLANERNGNFNQPFNNQHMNTFNQAVHPNMQYNNFNQQYGANMNYNNQSYQNQGNNMNSPFYGLGLSPQEEEIHLNRLPFLHPSEVQNYINNVRNQQMNRNINRNMIMSQNVDPRSLLQQELYTQQQEDQYHLQQLNNIHPSERQNYVANAKYQRDQRISNIVSSLPPDARNWFIQNLRTATQQNYGYPNQHNFNNGYNPNGYNPNLGYAANNPNLGYQNNVSIGSNYAYNNPDRSTDMLHSSNKYDEVQESRRNNQANNGFNNPGNFNQNQPRTNNTWNPSKGTYADIFNTENKQSNTNSNQPKKPIMAKVRRVKDPAIVQEMFNLPEEEDGSYASFNAEDSVEDHEEYGGRTYISVDEVENGYEPWMDFPDDITVSAPIDMSDQPDPVWDGQTRLQRDPNKSFNMNFNMGNAPTKAQMESRAKEEAKVKLQEIEDQKRKEYYIKHCVRILKSRPFAINNPPASSDVINTPMTEVEPENIVYAEKAKIASSLGEAVISNRKEKIEALGDNYMRGTYGAAYKLFQEKTYSFSMKSIVENFVLNAKDYQEFCNNLSGFFPAILEVLKNDTREGDKAKLLLEAYETYSYVVELDKHMTHLLNKYLQENLGVKMFMESISGDGIHMLREIQKVHGKSLFDIFNNQANMLLKSVKASYQEEEQNEVKEYMKDNEDFNVEDCKYVIRRSYILNVPIDEGKNTFVGNYTFIRESDNEDINALYKELRSASSRASEQLGKYGVYDMYLLTLTGTLYNVVYSVPDKHYVLTKVNNY